MWYKDDVIGMVETHNQRKKKNDEHESDEIHKQENYSNLKKLQAFQAF